MNDEIVYTETRQTQPGAYGQCTQYELRAYVEDADAQWETPRRIQVAGTVWAIGAGGAVESSHAYEDYQPEDLAEDEVVDTDRLREALHLSLSGTSLVGVDSYELPDGMVIERVRA